MDRLTPVVFNDAWGSHVAIAALQGRATPTPEPESELWMGAHESGPAGIDRPDAADLAAVVAADPVRELGPGCVQRFGPRLPFLLKVLAPERAISIQVHPSREQAAQVRARTGGEVYVDDYAKPELLLAVEPFEVFVGLREHAEVAAIARELAVPALTRLVESAASAPDPAHALLSLVLATPGHEVTAFSREVVAACARVMNHPDRCGAWPATIVEVSSMHPDDIGLVVLLLMHHRVLAPGEYVDVAPGVLHSYVRGVGVEVLANSDNVVRAGLTPKQVNVAELLRIVDPRADGVAGRARTVADGVEVFDSASDYFCLHRVAPGRDLPAAVGPRIVFCLTGQVRLVCGGRSMALEDAESAFLPADDGPVRLEGDGQVYVVATPETEPGGGPRATMR